VDDFIVTYWREIMVGLLIIFVAMLAYFAKVDRDRERKDKDE
jgi:hypothetical protein